VYNQLRLSAIAMLLAAAADAASGQQAIVKSLAGPATEVGYAYLAHYGERCLAVLPTHVAKEAGDSPALVREGPVPLLGEAAKVTDLGDDVSVVEVEGGIARDCGFSTMTISRAVERHIRANAIAAVRSINPDGTVAQAPVAIIDDDGKRFLRVKSTDASQQLRKGQSGSLLMAGDKPVGMLQAIDSRFDAGIVIRLDQLLEKLDAYLEQSPPSASRTMTSDASPSEKSLSELRLSNWSALPIDPQHRAANLLADSDAPSWCANVEQWPVELEIDLNGQKVALAGIELSAQFVRDPKRLPAYVELFVSWTQEQQRWRSVVSRETKFENESVRLEFAPTWARHLKIVIAAANNGGDMIELGRVKLIRQP
jgi:hypothetical protein